MDNINKVEWKLSPQPVDYQEAVAFMEQRLRQIQDNAAAELVWLLEHPHIYTTGTSANIADILRHDRCPIFNSGRGGQVTYHGPGQRIIYVMLNLQKRGPDLKKYVSDLEQWIINSLQQVGISADRRAGRIGIWVDTPAGEKKIAAIGVRVKKWVTMHGIALNINPDLSFFNDIVPCGLSNYGVTSLAQVLRQQFPVDYMDTIIQQEFANIFST